MLEKDWSNLTTVNFIGGFCGDFICSLAYNSYYDRPIFIDPTVIKASFNPNKIDGHNIVYDISCLRALNLLTDLYNIDGLENDLSDAIKKLIEIKVPDHHYMKIKTIFTIVNDKDLQTYVNNIYEVMRNIIKPCDTFTVVPIQNYGNILQGLDIQSIFPSSNNITITSSEEKYYYYFRILAYHKYYKGNLPDLTIKQAHDLVNQSGYSLFSKMQKPGYIQPDVPEKTIFADRFLFENNLDYLLHIKDVFNLTKPFDVDITNHYKKKNRQIIASYLDVNEDFDHTSQSNVAKAKAFIDNINS